MSFICMWQRSHSGKGQEFLIVLHCNEIWTRWMRRGLSSHVDNQTSCLLIFFSAYLDIHSFIWPMAHIFVNVSMRFYFKNPVKLQWSLRYICFILFVCPHIFINLFFFLSFLACRASTCSKTGDGCSYCYGSPADKRRRSSLWWSAS